jgi:hypothetical protein
MYLELKNGFLYDYLYKKICLSVLRTVPYIVMPGYPGYLTTWKQFRSEKKQSKSGETIPCETVISTCTYFIILKCNRSFAIWVPGTVLFLYCSRKICEEKVFTSFVPMAGILSASCIFVIRCFGMSVLAYEKLFN